MSAGTALVIGVTGQDGAYLSEFLLARGYRVHGLKRRSSSSNTGRIDRLLAAAAAEGEGRFTLHHGDLTDAMSLLRIIQAVEPDEIYNLGAQSHVQVSFEAPEYTLNVDAGGTLRTLEAMRLLGIGRTCRFYQASTSELFGNSVRGPQDEATPFRPRSPYGAAKVCAYWLTATYREAYGLHASNGILFNHESPLRGETFVTRKITRGVAAIERGLAASLRLGNLDSSRDWGHARDYVEGMWLMLRQEVPDDYVLATGETRTVREFVERAFAVVGRGIEWSGQGVDEVGRDARTGAVLVTIDPDCFRPAEVDFLLGDAAKARLKLGWEPRTTFDALVSEMVGADLAAAARAESGFGTGW